MNRPNFQIVAENCAFPEGPAFHPVTGNLWWVEIEAGILRSQTGETLGHAVLGRPNGLAFEKGGAAWICDQDKGLVRLSTSGELTDAFTTSTDGSCLDRPNDLAFDAHGNLVFTCPGNSRKDPTGRVWCKAPDDPITLLADGLYFPNGLAFVDAGRTLIVAETYRHGLWRGAWDAKARRWMCPEPWVEVGGPIGPDGMALAADGTLYVAIFDRGVIAAVSPKGDVDHIAVPGNRPTNVAFDPSGRMGLVVTEAADGIVHSTPNLGPGAGVFLGGAE